MTEIKPLNWTPKPGVGFTVVRREDGGMNLTFTDLSDSTLNDWRGFAMDHLLGSDRRTRNLDPDVGRVPLGPGRGARGG